MAKDTDVKAAALTALEANGRNYTRTAKDLRESGTNVSATTLRRWHAEMGERKSPAVEARMPEARATLTDRLESFVDAALTVAPGKLADANLRDTMTAVGIAIDKLRLLNGEATEVTELRGGETKRELLGLLHRLAPPLDLGDADEPRHEPN